MESVKPRFAVEAHLANLFAAEPVEEAQQVATQDEPASSEPSPQEVMAAPVVLPTALSTEQRAVLTRQNEEAMIGLSVRAALIVRWRMGRTRG
jgi:hypothetical protein